MAEIKLTDQNFEQEVLRADLPVLVFDETGLAERIRELKAAGCRQVRIHSPGQLQLAKEAGMHVCGSFRLNVWNSDALHWWYAAGADRVTVSPEARGCSSRA